MTEKDLIELCKIDPLKQGYAPWIYWPMELYSHGKMIRRFACFPSFFPLIAYGVHSSGTRGNHQVAKHELETTAPVFFAFSKKTVEKYKKKTGKASYCMISPAVFYRRHKSIEQVKNHKGTIAFFSHSTPSIDMLDSVLPYIEKLKELPKNYHPVTVCLHMHDINKGEHTLFQKHGFTVVTAGNTSSYSFIDNFYSLLQQFSYSTSSMIGAYTGLSIEMDIPFFTYGSLPRYENKKDLNLPYGEYKPYQNEPIHRDWHERLKLEKFNGTIDPTLKKEVLTELGVYDSISRIKMSGILWKNFLIWVCNPKNFIFLSYFYLNRILRFCGVKKHIKKLLKK